VHRTRHAGGHTTPATTSAQLVGAAGVGTRTGVVGIGVGSPSIVDGKCAVVADAKPMRSRAVNGSLVALRVGDEADGVHASTRAQLAADAAKAPFVINAVTSAALVTTMSAHDSVRLRLAHPVVTEPSRPRSTEIRIGTCDFHPSFAARESRLARRTSSMRSSMNRRHESIPPKRDPDDRDTVRRVDRRVM
jgi:hypothetical protein